MKRECRLNANASLPTRRQRIATGVFLLSGVLLVGWNVSVTWRSFKTKALGMLHRREVPGMGGMHAPYVALVKECAPTAKQGFFWTVPSLRSTVATDNIIEEVNYVCYPLHIRYRDEADVAEGDFIIAERCFRSMIECRLFESDLSDRFFHTAENATACIFVGEKP